MNTTFKFINIICATFLICSSCVEIEQTWPADGDNSIRFGVSAGFEVTGLKTKTVYEGNGDFGYTEDNGNKYENIYWDYDSDKIDVYCPQSPISRAHYIVKKDETTQGGAYLERIGDASLQWAGDNITHNFYAMYPSVKVFEDDELTTINQGIMMDGTTLKGVVPTLQNPVGDITATKNGEHYRYVAKPNMKYAYMAAKGTATKNNGQGVSLVFRPIITALQLELRMTTGTAVADVKIGEIYLDGEGIAGEFSADLSSNGWTGEYPTCRNIGSGSNRITISTWQTQNGVRTPLTLSAGDSFVFTVFLRPGQGISDLKVTISETGGLGISKTMSNYTITPNVKTVVTNFMLPAIAINVDNSDWLNPLPGETELKSLSIPGTGNSFSYLHSDATVKSQNLTFEQQWAMGIRAFEITTNRKAADFANEALRCNGEVIQETVNNQKQDLTINKVFTMIKNKLAGSENVDFAMVILNYQPGDGTDRDVNDYSKKVASFYDSNKDLFVLYSPDKTLNDVRGKVMLVMKTNQEDEDYAYEYETIQTNIGARNIVAINGCGSAKDKWRRRGYKAYDSNNNLQKAYNIWDSGKGVANETAGILIEDYMISTFVNTSSSANINNFTWDSWNSKVVLPEDGYSGNFSYECTNGGSTNNFSVWFQEWARVVPDGGVKKYIGYCETETTWMLFYTRIDSYTHYAVYWHESYKEKLNNAKKAFQLAVNGGVVDDKQHIIFNSLCGYFVDGNQSTYANSCFPYMQNPDDGHDHEGDELGSAWDGYGGNKGDIGKLAAKLNNDFYNYILEVGLNNSSGPTGVVLMDYLSNSSADGGSYYLPGVIIGNNFKYNVGTADKPSDIGSVENWEVETLD